MPRAIEKIHRQIPEKIEELYRKFPYESYAEPEIRRRLGSWGIKQHQLAYQECYSAASDAYLYSIHRCAFCGYAYVKLYIRKMIRIAVIWGLAIAYPDKHICKANQLREVRLETLERRDQW